MQLSHPALSKQSVREAHTALGSKQDSPQPALPEELCQCAQLCAEGPGIASLPGHSQGPDQRAWGGTERAPSWASESVRDHFHYSPDRALTRQNRTKTRSLKQKPQNLGSSCKPQYRAPKNAADRRGPEDTHQGPLPGSFEPKAEILWPHGRCQALP